MTHVIDAGALDGRDEEELRREQNQNQVLEDEDALRLELPVNMRKTNTCVVNCDKWASLLEVVFALVSRALHCVTNLKMSRISMDVARHTSEMLRPMMLINLRARSSFSPS